jgi:hypothetical protein
VGPLRGTHHQFPQHLWVDRLDEVVIEAGGTGALARLGRTVSGERYQQDLLAGGLFAEAAGDLIAAGG